MKIVHLADALTVSGQLGSSDLRSLHDAGVRLLINTRPDGEAPGQMPAAQAARAALSLGIDYLHLPVTMAAISRTAVERFGEAVAEAQGAVHAHCGSGLRVATLWGLYQVGSGRMSRAEVAERLAAAGFDFRPGLAWLDRQPDA